MADNVFVASQGSLKLLDVLFSACQLVAGEQGSSAALTIAKLPQAVQDELFELFPSVSNLTKVDIRTGLENMTESFISGKGRCRRINELRNSMFRSCVRSTFQIEWSAEERKLFEHDDSVIEHSSSASEQTYRALDEVGLATPRASIIAGQLLRTSTTGQTEMAGGGRAALQEHLDDGSKRLLQRVTASSSASARENFVEMSSAEVSSRLKENHEVQDLANVYLLKKMRRALAALRASSGEDVPVFTLQTRVVYYDYYHRSRPGCVEKVVRKEGGAIQYDVRLDSGETVRHVDGSELSCASGDMPFPDGAGLTGTAATWTDTSSTVASDTDGPAPVDATNTNPNSSASQHLELEPAINNPRWEQCYRDGEAAIGPLLSVNLDKKHWPPVRDSRPANYRLWFKVGAGTSEFWFDQKDIGVSYRDLLSLCGVPAEVLTDPLRGKVCAEESNRCFFLHLGLATGLNPFLLQACFRRESRRLLRESACTLEAAQKAYERAPKDTDPQIADANRLADVASSLAMASPDYLFEPVIQKSSLVDLEVLTHIWPVELAGFRICVVPMDCGGRLDAIICYTPSNSAHYSQDDEFDRWTGKDISLLKQCE